MLRIRVTLRYYSPLQHISSYSMLMQQNSHLRSSIFLYLILLLRLKHLTNTLDDCLLLWSKFPR